MRLTLRTLLAYLDDQMDAAEIKQFGQRVAESDAAQELIARIRQITRRRRLTTPPATGPGAFDPNTVAEYLDSVLPPDQVSDLEKTSLESDVHLAEIAACHQILTLILGQPALVPPTAKERMYELVHGREAISRKASNRRTTARTDEWEDDHEDGLLIPPGYRKSRPWLRWVLPVAGLFLLLGIGYALMNSVSPPHRNKPSIAQNTPKKGDQDSQVIPPDPEKITKPVVQDPKTDTKTEPKTDPKTDTKTEPKTDPKTDTKTEPKTEPKTNPMTDPVQPQPRKRPDPPSKERTRIGIYEAAMTKAPSILVVPQERPKGWKRVKPGNHVETMTPLVSLPAFLSEILLDSRVRLTLRGHVTQFSIHEGMDLLFDSAVVLYQNKDFDADVELLRGRLYVSNRSKPVERGPAKVRVRFGEEVWDLTLTEDNTEIGLDLLRKYSEDDEWRAGAPPITAMYLCVLKGKATLTRDTYHQIKLEAQPGNSLVQWDNQSGKPPTAESIKDGNGKPIPQAPPVWNKDLPLTDWKLAVRELKAELPNRKPEDAMGIQYQLNFLDAMIKQGTAMQGAMVLLDKMMTEDKPVDTVLEEGRRPSSDQGLRLLCIDGFSAIDKVAKLFDVLSEDAEGTLLDRTTAIFAIRHWLNRGPEQIKKLYDSSSKEPTGLLLDGRKFTPTEADRILKLLFGLNSDERTKEHLEELVVLMNNSKPALRQLAFWDLLRYSQGVQPGLPVTRGPSCRRYDPAWPERDRNAAVKEWERLIETGALRPRPPDRPTGK